MNSGIKIVYEDEEARVVTSDQIKSLISSAYQKLGLTEKHEIEIMWVTEKKIQDLNREFRQTDAPTDVLSFPQSESPNPEANILGSIVLNLKTIRSKNEEPNDAILHGLLHLSGYDHETDSIKWDKAARIIGCKL